MKKPLMENFIFCAVKIGSSFSSWCDINTCVHKDQSDDNILYSCNKSLEYVFSNLNYDLRNVLEWFKINSVKTNPRKF